MYRLDISEDGLLALPLFDYLLFLGLLLHSLSGFLASSNGELQSMILKQEVLQFLYRSLCRIS